ncbi:GNAT family N-acetyltransferase [Streptomyces yaanensis]|uniref:GNAT family N-acetyltransferase n=1 Tax=Streptomyces yaanensis TaxID=1142239 RepID=A0ABV7SMN4_9ACTN|nr:GNAT family N-acetyltransferase [Streptomyces sp. CGMCC 4.7035]WNC01889.1 GNAT family N-acetyltransferase [Streptomyces sp. CGMCC 4.7035]
MTEPNEPITEPMTGRLTEPITATITTADGRPFAVREAGPEDEPGVLALFEASTAYFEAATGLPSGPADLQSLYYSLPPGADWQDKRILVVTEDTGGPVAGIIDAVLRFPTPDACAVGLFLLHPGLWGTRVGPAVAGALLARATASGISRVTATVPAGWDRGHRFLASLSFRFTDPPAPAGPTTANRSTGPREPAVERAELVIR